MTPRSLDPFDVPLAELDKPYRPPFRCAAATDTGRVRQINEDNYLLAPEIGVFAVADGMGGHAAGDVASATTIECLASIGTAVSPGDLFSRTQDRILRANMAIQELARDRGHIIGTTVAVLLAFENDFACVWLGDSRIYRIRGGAIAQLSRDHTEVQRLLDEGTLTPEEAKAYPRRNVVTRAVGVQAEPELGMTHGAMEVGDVFLICSDGLTGHAEPAQILAELDGADPQAACDALIALALADGGTDNVTVVVVRYEPEPDAVDPPVLADT
ncbi:PP2C family protein-serine/threonine phosphatase [Methylobacterium longum]|uniref:Protein phosphatase 2C domain-containing protein n=1 Tax=Methylobacterium longum TaxID=767694 RepID=A0ABT8ATT2_9HYPH|nr:protein phosphatase 2C domain-containing protein [Methylobacterium longum]MDN3573337.1 protein phosphatase 2C domain-containing protein [Methylobacterium longum]GJE13951.1 PP2C-family Ser/Thr phosphatase [Methylobacterium longum]